MARMPAVYTFCRTGGIRRSSEQERAILALTEQMTLISTQGVSDEIYDNALALLGQSYLTEVMMDIVAMNAWNRIGITTGREPE